VATGRGAWGVYFRVRTAGKVFGLGCAQLIRQQRRRQERRASAEESRRRNMAGLESACKSTRSNVTMLIVIVIIGEAGPFVQSKIGKTRRVWGLPLTARSGTLRPVGTEVLLSKRT
jgi:hypothetical protein